MSTTTTIPKAKLGRNGPLIPRLGFGLMGLSAFYGGYESDEKRFEVLDRAIELGETFWDTSDVYGDNLDLLSKYFSRTPSAREKIFLASKFACQFDPSTQSMSVDSTPEYCRKALEKNLERLGVDSVDLFYVHRVDGTTPIEKTMEVMKQLQQEGKIKYIGLSEVSARTLRRASSIVHVDAVQLEYSPFALECEAQDERYGVLKVCRELGTAVVPYSPLGRGLLTGQLRSPDDFEDGDFRKYSPRFSKENFPKNLEIVDKLEQLAKKKNATPGQLALAWLLAQGDDIFPIPGTKKIKYLEENVGAVDVKLSKEEVDEIRAVVEAAEVAGGRYPDGFEDGLYADTPEL